MAGLRYTYRRMTTTRVVYFNGLGSGRPRRLERLAMRVALRYLGRHGISVRHMPVDWYAKEPFPDLLERMSELVQAELAEYGRVTLCGVSAGGSLAVDVYSRLHSADASVIVLCGPLRLATLAWWDSRTLRRIAFRDESHASQSFFDSVWYCSTVAIPALTDEDKRRIVTVQQWADDVVPRPTMGIPGVRVVRVPGVGHTFGIAVGVLCLPAIIKAFQRTSESSAGL